LGNSENEPLDQVSGSSGAGAVWHDVMEYLLTTDYNQATGIELTNVERIDIDGDSEWALQNDTITDHQNLLLEDNLILSIHSGDVFEFDDNLVIPLRARRSVEWTINGVEKRTAQETTFTPDSGGRYEIAAYDTETKKREIVLIEIIQQE